MGAIAPSASGGWCSRRVSCICVGNVKQFGDLGDRFGGGLMSRMAACGQRSLAADWRLDRAVLRQTASAGPSAAVGQAQQPGRSHHLSDRPAALHPLVAQRSEATPIYVAFCSVIFTGTQVAGLGGVAG
jgi:hypothetical protein